MGKRVRNRDRDAARTVQSRLDRAQKRSDLSFIQHSIALASASSSTCLLERANETETTELSKTTYAKSAQRLSAVRDSVTEQDNDHDSEDNAAEFAVGAKATAFEAGFLQISPC